MTVAEKCLSGVADGDNASEMQRLRGGNYILYSSGSRPYSGNLLVGVHQAPPSYNYSTKQVELRLGSFGGGIQIHTRTDGQAAMMHDVMHNA